MTDTATDTQCVKCSNPFNEDDQRLIYSARRHAFTPFCQGCITRCNDSEIADHWCPVDQWYIDAKKEKSR